MSITEHKCISTLENYDPIPEIDERIDGAVAIMAVRQPKPKIRIETVTSQVTKTVSRTSIHHDLNQDGVKTGQKTGTPKKDGREAFLQQQAADEGDYFQKIFPILSFFSLTAQFGRFVKLEHQRNSDQD